MTSATLAPEASQHGSPRTSNATFSSLRYRGYRLWFAGALVCNIGTWMQRVAQDWLVLTVLTNNSGVAVGITTALQFGPVLALTPIAGVIADRVDRRRMLMVTQGSIGALAAALGVLVLSGQAQLWQVYVAAAGLGVAAAFDGPVRQTFVGELVPKTQLANAVGLNAASFNAARLIGPAVAGVTIAAAGIGWVFVINAASMLGTVGALVAMRPADLHPVPSAPREPGQLREGLAYVRSRRDVLAIMVVVGVVSTFGLNFQLTSAMMARVEFGQEAGAYGLLGSILAVGSLTGALLAARRERPRVRLVIGAAFGFAVATGVQALMPTFWSYALAGIPVGLAALTMLTAANAAIQTSTPPQFRGRVMALYMMVLLGTNPIGSPLVGWIGQTFGPRWSIGIGTLAALVVSVAVAAWARRAWDVQVSLTWCGRQGDHREPAPAGPRNQAVVPAVPARS
ncbi:MAG: MFS transporter [Micrococcales bacterium]|nr:MFS transporter [Micrococcales bacterium]